MNSISVISSVAMAVGLAASLPQIVRMKLSRSSGGQSVLGWGMGLVTNLSMAYVNLVGFGAFALMVSNVVSGALCVAAMALIVRYGEGIAPAAAADPAGDDLADPAMLTLRVRAPAHTAPDAVRASLADLPTTEFVALSEAVLSAREHRAASTAHAAAQERAQLAFAA